MEKMKLQGEERSELSGHAASLQPPRAGTSTRQRIRLTLRKWGRRKKGEQTGQEYGEGWNHHRRLQGQRTGCCTPYPADGHLPGGDADSMDEARGKKSQQEAEKNWGGKRGQEGGGEPGIACAIRAKCAS